MVTISGRQGIYKSCRLPLKRREPSQKGRNGELQPKPISWSRWKPDIHWMLRFRTTENHTVRYRSASLFQRFQLAPKNDYRLPCLEFWSSALWRVSPESTILKHFLEKQYRGSLQKQDARGTHLKISQADQRWVVIFSTQTNHANKKTALLIAP